MLCSHFGVCGGCKLQDIDYNEQLILKKELISKQAYKQGIELPEFELIASPKVFFYRNKIELSFAPGRESVLLGFHQKGKDRSIVDIKECLLFSEKLPEILSVVREFVKESGLPAYHKYEHKGFWRYCVLRRNRKQDYILAIVTSSQGKCQPKGLLNKIESLSYIKGVFWVTCDRLGDAVGYDRIEQLHGEEVLIEEICGVKFFIGLRGFFQVNPWATELLYNFVLDYVIENVKGKILDLYAGSGGVGLVLAKQGFDVLGIEIEEGAVSEAKRNVVANEIRTYSMLKGNVRALLGINPDWRKKFNCVIIDPPRSGMPPKVRYRVVKLKAEHIIYISCNPITFMQDLKELLTSYDLVKFSALDMFPHTPHIEVLAFLRKKS